MTDPRDAMQAGADALFGLINAIDGAGYSTEFQRNLSRAASALSILRAALEAREEPKALDDGVPSAKEAIAYAFKRWGYAQGTKECIAFYRGACWLQLAASPVAADTQGDAQDAVAGSDGWSSDQPSADGLWLWREGGKDHVVTLRLCSDGAEVDDAEEDESEDSYQAYWMRTATDQRNMPGLWKRAAMKEQPSDGAALCGKGLGGCVAGECPTCRFATLGYHENGCPRQEHEPAKVRDGAKGFDDVR